MAGWIKMLLGMEIGLGSGDIVLDGDAASPRKGAQQPNFSAPSALERSSISATSELLFRYARGQTDSHAVCHIPPGYHEYRNAHNNWCFAEHIYVQHMYLFLQCRPIV